MKIRIFSALAALILAVTGAVMILGYVNGADQRALAGTKTRGVLVVTKQIAAGTPSATMADSVTLKAVPISVIPSGTVDTLSALSGSVAAVDLVPGEQLLRSRMVKPSSLLQAGTVAVPKGLQELTVQLGPDRVVGGRVKAGDRVGIYVSYPKDGQRSSRTSLAYDQILVTNVQGAPAAPVAAAGGSAAPAAPTGALLVTLAVQSAQATRAVFTAEFGSLWITLESSDVPVGVPREMDLDTPIP
ncbi:MAG: Flp pilus assembly protein CpaB [Microbacteriaceae bacterium]|nr:Flp pilus assembly protein CpaB [Microbacteriaceae bacterium]